MELKILSLQHSQKPGSSPSGAEQGFALVTLLALIPMIVALFVALSAAFYFLKRKSLAQAHCVQQAALMQTDLHKTLDQLLRLNPRAKSLRQQRQTADKALKAALSSVNPYAIAAAKAYWTAVVLQQLALRAQQEKLLRTADRQRQRGHRKLRERLRALKISRVDSRQFYWRALAVEAQPLASLTPDYKPLPLFSHWQQHRFRFVVDLRPPFTMPQIFANLKQITECSVSLKGKEKQWQVQILAANASSKWSWF